VYFKAPITVAASIEQRLRKDAMFDRDEAELHTTWIIHGLFDENYDLTFLLHSPEHHRRSHSLWMAAWFFGLNRKRLDAELLSLADIVEQAVLLNVRDIDKPDVAAQDNENGNGDQSA
jgi:hypothetical protein